MLDNIDKRSSGLSLLIKPTNMCNLNCKYCYDREARIRNGNKIMTKEMIDKIARMASEYAKEITWIWHGGEPLILGVDYYRDKQDIFYKYYNSMFKQELQTNGTLLNDEWIKFFKEYKISFGVSYDSLFQKVRDPDLRYDYDKMLKYVTEYGNAGAITVINSESYKYMIDIYNDLKEKGLIGLAFNIVFDSEGVKENHLRMSPDDYVVEFLKFLDFWVHDKDNVYISERTAIEAIELIFGGDKTCCTYHDCRLGWLGVNSYGDIYPCDREIPGYSFGNLNEFNSIEEIHNSEKFRKYYNEVAMRFKTHCSKCGYFSRCHGGCNSNAITSSGSASGVDIIYCQLFRKRFNEVYKYFRDFDLYDDNVSKYIKAFFYKRQFYTLKEIKKILHSKFNFDDELQFSDKGAEIFNSIEFKIFNIFNPNRVSDETGHLDYNLPKVVLQLDFQGDFITQMKFEREREILEIANNNASKILELLNINRGLNELKEGEK